MSYPPPISRLPVEILREVFLEVVAVSQITPIGCRAPGWIALTYVCQHWREVALEHKALWRHITVNLSAHWAVKLFERSNPAPIAMDIYGRTLYEPWYGPILQDVLQKHTSRLQELSYIENFYDDAETGLYDLFIVNPAPLLEHLRIEANSRDITLISDIFAGNAPRLRSLTLEGPVDIGSNDHLLGNVRCLTLLSLASVPYNIRVLRQTPLAEEVEIMVGDEELPLPRPTAHDSVKLPHLRKFTLDTLSLDSCLAMFDNISFPEALQLRLRVRTSFHVRNHPSTSFQRLLDVFARHTFGYRESSTQLKFRNVCVNIKPEHWVRTWGDVTGNSGAERPWYVGDTWRMDHESAVSLQYSWTSDDSDSRSAPGSLVLSAISRGSQSLCEVHRLATCGRSRSRPR